MDKCHTRGSANLSDVCFGAPLPLTELLSSLFSEAFVEKLDFPVGLRAGMVAFTQFIKCTASVVNQVTLFEAVRRRQALIYSTDGGGIDIVIPVILLKDGDHMVFTVLSAHEQNAVTAANMSAVIIKVAYGGSSSAMKTKQFQIAVRKLSRRGAEILSCVALWMRWSLWIPSRAVQRKARWICMS